MDSTLKELVDLAVKRGNKYVKGETVIEGLSEKLAELGVLLLEKSAAFQGSTDNGLKEELIEIQNKLDDLRKSVFACKAQAK